MKFKSVKAIAACLLLLFPLIIPGQVLAQTDWESQDGCVIDGVATIQGIECLVQNVLVVAIQLIGLAVLIMLIVGGFKYLTAQGDPKATESAKSTLTYAMLGLVLTVSAYMILYFISDFTGVTSILDFSIILPNSSP